MDGVIYLSVILVLLLILYKRWSRVFDYWKERGLPHRKPVPLLGNMKDNVLRKKSMGEIMKDICEEFNDCPLVGMYNFASPALLVNDVEYAKLVLIKEFSHFMDRGAELKHKREMDNHLFVLTGAEWKAVRMKMSPVFTTGRLKGMAPLVEDCFRSVGNQINLNTSNVIELKDISDNYIIRVTASAIFGIEPAQLEKDSTFKTTVDSITKMSFTKFLCMTLTVWFTSLAILLDVSPMGKDVENYFRELILKTLKERVESGKQRNDVIQLLLQLKQTGKVEVSQWVHDDDAYLNMDQHHANSETVEITDGIIISQALIFMLAGNDALRTSISLTLVELAKNKDIQVKAREEVDKSIEKHKEFSYQALKDMEYLEMCIKESMRIYAPSEFLSRHCTKPYTFPDGTKVEKGTQVFVPLSKFHMDPELFPEPNSYRPERFEQEPATCSYLAFGEGSRICIAMRFATILVKMFVANMVYNYDFSLDPKTELPVKYDPWFFLKRPTSSIYLKLVKREH